MVMATGIVSTAAFVLGRPKLGLALFGINLIAYALLWAASLTHAALDPRAEPPAARYGEPLDQASG